MSIAILHDYFDEIGGAEITLLILARTFGATIITTNINRDKIHELGFDDIRIRSIGTIPQTAPLKQYMARYRFARLRLTGYSMYLVGGSYALFAAKRHRPNVWYVGSIPVGLYEKHRDNGLITPLWRWYDRRAVARVDQIIANSHATRHKIRRYYNRDSAVVYHPVDVSAYYAGTHKNYWLSVNRIDHYKRIELQLETFRQLPNERLVIVGAPSRPNEAYFEQLRASAPDNVSFLGGVYDRRRLLDLYSRCTGLVATARGEDFGMTPLEAMAAGKPVVAVDDGGYPETVRDGETGRLTPAHADKLAVAIREVGAEPERYKDACCARAQAFDTSVFIRAMRAEIDL